LLRGSQDVARAGLSCEGLEPALLVGEVVLLAMDEPGERAGLLLRVRMPFVSGGNDQAHPLDERLANEGYELPDLGLAEPVPVARLPPEVAYAAPHPIQDLVHVCRLPGGDLRVGRERRALGHRRMADGVGNDGPGRHRIARLTDPIASIVLQAPPGHDDLVGRIATNRSPVIDEDHVTAGHADTIEVSTALSAHGREAERETQRVFRRPLDLDDRLLAELIDRSLGPR